MEAHAFHNFSLKATLESGQIFRYSSGTDGFYYVVVGDSIIKLRQTGNNVFYDCSNSAFDVRKFLGLSHSYDQITASISKDEKIAAAIKKHRGLRIIEQDVWECAASFICSAFSNIPRIRQCIEKIAAAFGSGIEFDNFQTFSFPQPQQISDFSRLKKCGLGYRAKYLFETARIFAKDSDSFSQRQLRRLSYEKAKERLLELPGVGSKVADCILLFSCGFYEAFPVDVWIQRTMERHYGSEIASFAAARRGKSRELNVKVVADFARSYFGKYAGYAQQFLFHDARTYKKTI